MSPEMVSKISIWRAKAGHGNLSIEEMREAIAALRQERVGAAIASDRSRRAKAKAEIPDANDLLKEMEDL